ncbi:hypothetical protein BBJ29_010141 [Phytophthora kernoviae]|uniref:Cysteine dioxygenase n=2 Tax=Phytophthora kernoviae TaxID=325452 RepID=A0A3R7JLL6_9STRA|nr:hypothetical protein BBJ29_010141 [Phytophthora kernoviae]
MCIDELRDECSGFVATGLCKAGNSNTGFVNINSVAEEEDVNVPGSDRSLTAFTLKISVQLQSLGSRSDARASNLSSMEKVSISEDDDEVALLDLEREGDDVLNSIGKKGNHRLVVLDKDPADSSRRSTRSTASTASSSYYHEDEETEQASMDFLNAVWHFTFGDNKELAEGQKALEAIQDLLVKAIIKYKGAPHALTLDEIEPIKAICDQLFPANFQLKVPSAAEGGPERPKRVHYEHVYEDETFSIGIFILPPGVSIPLHDHPGMSVISRVLYGSLHVKAYDLVPNEGARRGNKSHMARLRVDEVVTAPLTVELLPERNNLHELTGGDDIGCAFFDIITPPYDADDGRDCTYYRVVNAPISKEESSDKMVMLESYNPTDFDVTPEHYHGPRLQRYVC